MGSKNFPDTVVIGIAVQNYYCLYLLNLSLIGFANKKCELWILHYVQSKFW